MVGKMHTEQKIFGINASTKWKYDVFFLPDTDKIFFFFFYHFQNTLLIIKYIAYMLTTILHILYSIQI